LPSFSFKTYYLIKLLFKLLKILCFVYCHLFELMNHYISKFFKIFKYYSEIKKINLRKIFLFMHFSFFAPSILRIVLMN
jgi:hypothetical protein